MANQEVTQRQKRAAQRKAKQDKNLFSRLAAASASSRTQAQKCLRQAGVSPSIVEWRVLWDLVEAGPLSVRELATIQRNDHSLISRALPKMESKGYVALSQDKTDKRHTVVTITPDGRAAHAKAAPVMKARRAALRAAFTKDEITMFLDFIERFEGCLEDPMG